MAGTGSNTVLDKGFAVLTTYNSSAAAGVVAYRCVALGTAGTIDLNATSTAANIGVVQESIDRAKVATGKAVANVRVLGITQVVVANTPGSITIGSKVAASTAGGVKLAVSTNVPLGIVVGAVGTPAEGDLIDVLLTPGLAAI